MEQVKLSRYRTGDFVVNCPVTNRKFVWSGAKGNKISTIPVPQETYDWLVMSTSTFRDGELVVQDENAKEELGYSEDLEDIEKNTHTKEEIEKILTGNYNAMQKKLKEITNEDEKRFVLNVARELKIDSSAKRQFIVQWVGIEGLSTDEVFMKDED